MLLMLFVTIPVTVWLFVNVDRAYVDVAVVDVAVVDFTCDWLVAC